MAVNSRPKGGDDMPAILEQLDHDQRIAVVDHITFRNHDLRNRPGHVGEDRNLHLHRLQDHHSVVGCHLLAQLDLDFHHGRDELGDDGMAHAVIVGFRQQAFR
jgi:hypothetical protein